jgi:hypothetical protein
MITASVASARVGDLDADDDRGRESSTVSRW